MTFYDRGGSRFSKEEQAALEFDQTLLEFERKLGEAERIDPHGFIELYGEANVEIDLRYVKEMKERFAANDTTQEKNLKRISDVFERIIMEQIELHDWFGPNTMTVAASEYDDIKNGVDIIVEITEEDSRASSHLGLGIDITYNTNLEKKFLRIKNEIKSGKLTEVKYFQSADGSFTGRLNRIPRVVIGVQKETIAELMKLTLNKKKKELAQHVIQYVILSEIYTQLIFFAKFARDENVEGGVVQRLLQILDLIGDIMSKKEDELGGILDPESSKFVDYTQDRVYREIMDQVKNIFT